MYKLVVVALAALVLAANADAATYYVTAKYTGTNPGKQIVIKDYSTDPRLKLTTWAGVYNFKIKAGTTYTELGGVGDVFHAMCIDIGNPVYKGRTYTWEVVDPTEGPTPDVYSDGKINETERLALQRLYGMHYATGTTTHVDAAAFQAAVWEIVNESEGVWDVTAGNFQASSVNTAKANMYLATSSSYDGPLPTFVALVSDRAQDQLVMLPTYSPPPPPPPPSVPEPMSMITLALGLGGVGGYLRRRFASAG